tara:strand:+ start:429 stop:575 length:147 start_codon:yes stop_codon:yes gene_type:complete
MKIWVTTPSLLEKSREPPCNSVSDFAVLNPKPDQDMCNMAFYDANAVI